MWIYEKRLQFPVNIKETNAQLAQAIISQYGGPDGEMGASMRYLSQRYAMPDNKVKSNSYGYWYRRTWTSGNRSDNHLSVDVSFVHRGNQRVGI